MPRVRSANEQQWTIADAQMQQGSRGKYVRVEVYGQEFRGVDRQRMRGGEKKTGKPAKGKQQHQRRHEPDWAHGLKQLYDSVVEEPIPDAFKDLLTKLDSGTK